MIRHHDMLVWKAHNTRNGYDPPTIVWIHLTKFGVSLTFRSGVIVCQSKIQTQLYSENVKHYQTALPVASLKQLSASFLQH